MGVPLSDLEGCTSSHRILLERLSGLTDAQARAPSLLPDWTIGHVLTHLARNADSVTRRLRGAADGQIVDQYPGGYAGRAAEIAEGAGRPADELVADVADSAARMEALWWTLPPEAWNRATRDVSGAERPAHTLVWRRWREVEAHHVDLGLGYLLTDWPNALVAVWLAKELERLPVRTDPKALLAWLVGRGPVPPLAPW